MPGYIYGSAHMRNYIQFRHRYDLDFGKDKVLIPNDVLLIPLRSRPGDDKTKAALMVESGTSCPPRRLERTNPTFNIYRVGDLKFTVPTRTSAGIRERKVLAECGPLLGLEDFKFKNKPYDDDSRLYSWTKLKTTCQVSSVLDGLKEGTGEVTVQIQPLRMLVRMPNVESSLPKIEMNHVEDANVIFRGLEELSSEAIKAMQSEIKIRMVCLVNEDLRNILKDSIQEIVKRSSSMLSKMVVPL
ncbi:uncharacterized protein TNIN_373281 [Trichonephila inaurata madagascariensis]|uniref:Uncharacterized protein n=1 Tax=Trichonephila inaurata madagascariensis TaxID=2747483 RepID=A0A8X6Y812_9ARAC|nr:uncharacterized protein TNIN_373281 [Trichonephila inaurata madagascariensis]